MGVKPKFIRWLHGVLSLEKDELPSDVLRFRGGAMRSVRQGERTTKDITDEWKDRNMA